MRRSAAQCSTVQVRCSAVRCERSDREGGEGRRWREGTCGSIIWNRFSLLVASQQRTDFAVTLENEGAAFRGPGTVLF